MHISKSTHWHINISAHLLIETLFNAEGQQENN